MAGYKLMIPKSSRLQKRVERTYREIVYFKDGNGECKLRATRDALVRRGFIDVTDANPVTRKNLKKVNESSASKKREEDAAPKKAAPKKEKGFVDRVKDKLKGK